MKRGCLANGTLFFNLGKLSLFAIVLAKFILQICHFSIFLQSPYFNVPRIFIIFKISIYYAAPGRLC